ncbi:MAG: phosphohistidine phosphatase SixA [Planctomycetota bacterium]
MWIYLLRHGIAEDPQPGQSDDERALTEQGWRRLRRAAPAWSRLVGGIDVLVSSPLRRARETATVLAEAGGFRGELRIDEGLVPGAAPALALAMLEAELLSGTDSVAVVGHEPHLGYLLGTLLTGHPRVTVPFKKGMLVGLEATSPTSLATGLRFTLTQKAAARLTD